MFDTIGLVLCVVGAVGISAGQSYPVLLKPGFAVSAAGSLAWLFFGIGVQSIPLLVQSVLFFGAWSFAFATKAK